MDASFACHAAVIPADPDPDTFPFADNDPFIAFKSPPKGRIPVSLYLRPFEDVISQP